VAERHEHELTPEQVDRLDAALGHPALDPHGDPIPAPDGQLPERPTTPLTTWPAGEPAVVVHLEDEPPLVYAQLVATGLFIGQVLRIVDASSARIVVADGETEYRLAPVIAGNVFVTHADAAGATTPARVPLASVPVGSPVDVVALRETCRGYTRRRLLDLGFTPGTRVVPALDTFAGDPRAYRVRGTTIALRREQAQQILVRVSADAATARTSRTATVPAGGAGSVVADAGASDAQGGTS
jgi:DtxR family Mn-dependent transcriptional regulator